MTSGVGKREYSDLAVKLLRNVQDAVERKHYEKMVARKLDCDVEDLRAKKVAERAPRRLKKIDAKVEMDILKGLRESLQAILIYGKVTEVKGVELPEEEDKLAELAMIFDARYKGWELDALTQEAQGLLARYKDEVRSQEVRALNEQLAQAEDAGDEEKVEEILRQIMVLKKS